MTTYDEQLQNIRNGIASMRDDLMEKRADAQASLGMIDQALEALNDAVIACNMKDKDAIITNLTRARQVVKGLQVKEVA